MDIVEDMLNKLNVSELTRYLAFLKCLQEFSVEREQLPANLKGGSLESFELR